jgi:acyl-CoA synthetase (AMP-forming)/AMP-acid ligase II
MIEHLGQLTGRAARRAPEGTALVFDGRETSFSELHRSVDDLARELRALGIGPGLPLTLSMANSPELVTALLAAWAVDAFVVEVPPSLGPAGLRSVIDRTHARVLLTDRGFERTDPGAAGGAGRATTPSDPRAACVTFTSGSTGVPKGVVLGHDNLLQNAQIYVEHFGLTPADRTALVLPLSFGMNKIALLAHLLVGATVLLERSFMVPNQALAAMAAHGGTGLCLVPAAAAHLLARGDLDRHPLRRLRYIRIGAGRMEPELVGALGRTFPGAEIHLTYGLTEVGLVARMASEEFVARPDACGRVIPEVEVRVDPGGRIVVACDHPALGYWDDEGETQAVFRPDGVHTGDIGRLDDEGYLYLLGRDRELIKSGGESILPIEVETALLTHPDVAECVVVGVPDAWLGQAVAAFVVPRPGADVDEAALRTHVNRVLPPIKRPSRYTVCSTLPKTDWGKVRRRDLAGTLEPAPAGVRTEEREERGP